MLRFKMKLERARQFKRSCLIAVWLLSVCWMVVSSGCSWFGGGGNDVKKISAAQPEVAREAMNKAAQSKNRRAIVPLVKRLYDEDSAIRMLAIGALENITGQDMGYRSYGSEVERAEAIKRWEAYLVQEGLQNGPVDSAEQN